MCVYVWTCVYVSIRKYVCESACVCEYVGMCINVCVSKYMCVYE